MGYENLTKAEIIELLDKEREQQDATKEFLQNMNKLLEKMNSGGVGAQSKTTIQQVKPTVPLMWCSMGMLPVEIPNKNTNNIIVTFDKTWEVRDVDVSDVKHLVNSYRNLFREGKLVFVDKEDAKLYNMEDIDILDADKILSMLKLPINKLMDNFADLTDTMQRAFLWHCAKQVKYGNEDYVQYSYNKIKPLWSKFGNAELDNIIATLTFVDEDYDGSDVQE